MNVLVIEDSTPTPAPAKPKKPKKQGPPKRPQYQAKRLNGYEPRAKQARTPIAAWEPQRWYGKKAKGIGQQRTKSPRKLQVTRGHLAAMGEWSDTWHRNKWHPDAPRRRRK